MTFSLKFEGFVGDLFKESLKSTFCIFCESFSKKRGSILSISVLFFLEVEVFKLTLRLAIL